MRAWAYLPLLACVLFGALAPRAASRLPPATASRLLAAGALIAAATCATVLALLAFTAVGQVPQIAGLGHWSRRTLHQASPVSRVVGWACLAVLTALGALSARAVRRQVREVVGVYRLAAAFAEHPTTLVVVSDPVPQAFALPALPRLPGRGALPGRIVATQSLLRTLDAGQRRAMLAHEHAHLARRHHYYTLAARLAAATNPLLWRLPAAVTLATERWADEDAAVAVGDRALVARALGAAARHGPAQNGGTAALARDEVPERVRALMSPPPARRPVPTAAAIVLLLLAAGATAICWHDTERLFEAAKHAYRITHPVRPR